VSEKNATGSPGVGPLAGVLDSMEFLSKAWTTFNLPTSLAPTVDLDEIDRRIADLRTVEQWLEVNLGMLRSAIQGMEIQRGTLAAIRAFGEAMSRPGEGGDAAARTIAAIGEMQRAAAAAAQAAAGAAAARAAAGVTDAAARATSGAVAQSTGGTPASGKPRGSTGVTPASGKSHSSAGDGPAAAATGASEAAGASPGAAGAGPSSLADELSRAAAAAVSPASWWKLLQSQFGQVAQAALAGAAVAAGGDSQQSASRGRTARERASSGGPRKRSATGPAVDRPGARAGQHTAADAQPGAGSGARRSRGSKA